MENDPRRRRSRGGRRRGGGGASGGPDRKGPTRTPAEPKATPQARGIVRRDRGPQQRKRPPRPPRSPDELRSGTPCVIVMDCREGEPDRTGAAAVFEGFFDLETGDPRRAGYGVPRLRVVRPAVAEPLPAEPSAEPAAKALQVPERLWGFECWWRPDPGNTGMTDTDRLEVEESKKLLRGLMRDSRRSTRPALPR